MSLICASAVIWLMNFLVLRGVKEATFLNIITTVSKLIPLFVFIVAVIFIGAFDIKIFMHNFWGDGSMSLLDQVKATTGATVWSFIGVEGAVVLSARAKKSSDVGKASITGFIGLLSIYIMVAVLSLGVMPAEEIAQLSNPQMAGILQAAVGPWGASLINFGVVLSLSGALLGWTIIAADCPYSAAKQGVFMKAFAKDNAKGSPAFSLFVTNGIIQVFLIIVYFNASTYQLFYNLSASMIMIPYLFSALYYAKVTFKKEGQLAAYSASALTKERFIAVLGSIYGIWMLYSGGLSYLLATTVLYALGLIVFVLGRKERKAKVFFSYELIVAVGIVVLAVISVVMIANGSLDVF
jgi:arginine:ornithine antiporter/lysine permease